MSSPNDVRTRYDKPALPLPQQIDHLEGLGLTIPDRGAAERHLDFLGLYRLSGYFQPFMDGDGKDFRPGTSLDDVLALYVFDRRLRLLTMDALERVEIAVRTRMSNFKALARGPFWMTDPDTFRSGTFESVTVTVAAALRDRQGRIKHDHILTYQERYSEPENPPCWMLIEALTFGDVSRLFKNLQDRRDIARAFGLQHDVLASWLHTLTFVRNICAHHGRLWNRQFTIAPKIPREYGEQWPAAAQRRYYIVACLLQHLMQVIAEGSQWAVRLRTLLSDQPASVLTAMAFPAAWDSSPFWAPVFAAASEPVVCPHTQQVCHPPEAS